MLLLSFSILLLPAASGYREGPPLGSEGSTHQFLMDQAVAILEGDGHVEIARWLRGAFLEEMRRGTIRADRTLVDSREHYHDPWTHTGLAGFRSAGELATEQFDLAVARWFAGDRVGAGFHLGWAAHMVQDLTVPHHARLTPLNYHAEYETYVLANQASAAVVSNGSYEFPTKLPGHFEDEADPSDWVDYSAHRGYDRFSDVSFGDPNGFRQAMGDLLPAAQRTTAGFVLMFLRTVNTPPQLLVAGPATASVGHHVTLVAHVEEDVAVSETAWMVNGTVIGRGRDVVLLFGMPGEYVVDVRVTDALGATAEHHHVIRVSAVPDLEATITGPVKVSVGVPAIFRVETAAVVSTYEWFADDVPVGVKPELEINFDRAGMVRVEAAIQTEGGDAARPSHLLVVEDTEPPRVDLPPSFRVRVGESLALDARRYVSGTDVAMILWYVGGERRVGTTASFGFESDSTQTLTLIAHDYSGNFGLDRTEVIVEAPDGSVFAALWPATAATAIGLAAASLVAIEFLLRRRR